MACSSSNRLLTNWFMFFSRKSNESIKHVSLKKSFALITELANFRPTGYVIWVCNVDKIWLVTRIWSCTPDICTFQFPLAVCKVCWLVTAAGRYGGYQFLLCVHAIQFVAPCSLLSSLLPEVWSNIFATILLTLVIYRKWQRIQYRSVQFEIVTIRSRSCPYRNRLDSVWLNLV